MWRVENKDFHHLILFVKLSFELSVTNSNQLMTDVIWHVILQRQ